MQSAELPTGTITFVFTAVEGASRLLSDLPDQYDVLLERHRSVVRDAVGQHSGVEITVEADSFFCVFSTAADALAAAVRMQQGMAAVDWPAGHTFRLRVGVHTGVAALAGDQYVGLDVNRAARIAEAGHGGQVLASAVSRMLGESGLPDGVSFIDLGEVRLRDLDQPEHLYQLAIDGLESTFPALRKMEWGLTNLPASPSSFVGRDRELGEVHKLLDESRLVTLTGLAGTGKSRLALETAADSRGRFRDGVWLVELATVSSDDLVARAITHALGLQESPGRVAEDVLVDYLRDGEQLLVLDSCERAIEGVRDLVTRLMTEVVGLTILATSQQVLDLAGETRYPCPPLEVPPASARTVSDVMEFDSARLFVTRAKEVDAEFDIDSTNAAHIASICQRLDGVPLAIELAAALVRILTVDQILARLDDRFDLLRGGPRSAPERQQTLKAALDSTFDLLDESRQEFAVRLGVFEGGFDLLAAEAVASGDGIGFGEVVDGLSALVDRSLIVSTQTDAGVRMTILESVRRYLLGRLESSGQLEVRREAHAKHYMGIVREAAGGIRGPDQDHFGRVLDAEIDNIRGAIEFTAAAGDEAALDIVNRMFLYWTRRGDWSDGLHWTREALQGTSSDDSPLRARMLATAGFFASDLGDGRAGLADMDAGLEMARRTGDLHAQGYCCSFLGAELSRRDIDLVRGLELLIEAQGIYRQLGEPYGEAWVNRYLALAHLESGELDESIRLQTASYEAFQKAGDAWNIRMAQAHLGEAMHTVGELDQSRQLYDESLRGSSGRQYKVVVAHALKGLGKVSLTEAKYDEASDHLNEAIRELREIGDVGCTAESRGHLAMVKLGRGHPVDAGHLLLESLDMFWDIGDQGGISWTLERLAAVAEVRGRYERAARLLSAAVELRHRSGSVRPAVDQDDFDALWADVVDACGRESFDAEVAAGAALDLDGMLELGRGV